MLYSPLKVIMQNEYFIQLQAEHDNCAKTKDGSRTKSDTSAWACSKITGLHLLFSIQQKHQMNFYFCSFSYLGFFPSVCKKSSDSNS